MKLIAIAYKNGKTTSLSMMKIVLYFLKIQKSKMVKVFLRLCTKWITQRQFVYLAEIREQNNADFEDLQYLYKSGDSTVRFIIDMVQTTKLWTQNFLTVYGHDLKMT